MSKCYHTDIMRIQFNTCCTNWACGSALRAFIPSICSPCAAVNVHFKRNIWGLIHAFKTVITLILKLQWERGGFMIDSISFHLNLQYVITSVFCPGDSEASGSSVKKDNYSMEHALNANWPYMWL